MSVHKASKINLKSNFEFISEVSWQNNKIIFSQTCTIFYLNKLMKTFSMKKRDESKFICVRKCQQLFCVISYEMWFNGKISQESRKLHDSFERDWLMGFFLELTQYC